MRSITIEINGVAAVLPDVASDTHLMGMMQALGYMVGALVGSLQTVPGFDVERLCRALAEPPFDGEGSGTARAIVDGVTKALAGPTPPMFTVISGGKVDD